MTPRRLAACATAPNMVMTWDKKYFCDTSACPGAFSMRGHALQIWSQKRFCGFLTFYSLAWQFGTNVSTFICVSKALNFRAFSEEMKIRTEGPYKCLKGKRVCNEIQQRNAVQCIESNKRTKLKVDADSFSPCNWANKRVRRNSNFRASNHANVMKAFISHELYSFEMFRVRISSNTSNIALFLFWVAA